MNSTTANLIKAKALINDVGKLCRAYYAVNYLNHPVDALSEDACQYCASGAICKILNLHSDFDLEETINYTNTPEWQFLNDATRKFFDKSPAEANDSLSHEDLMKCYDEAIRLSSV